VASEVAFTLMVPQLSDAPIHVAHWFCSAVCAETWLRESAFRVDPAGLPEGGGAA
jgi:hypothetical protein